MFEKIFWYIVAGYLSIFLTTRFIPGTNLTVSGASTYFGILFDEEWKLILLIGAILGLINFFVKPILDKITIPLKILTLGLFSLAINMGLIWSLDVFFEEFQIAGIIPLFLTTVVVGLVNFFLGVKQ